jgi:hypothetical protein
MWKDVLKPFVLDLFKKWFKVGIKHEDPIFFLNKTQDTQFLGSGRDWKTKFLTCYAMNKQSNMIF